MADDLFVHTHAAPVGRLSRLALASGPGGSLYAYREGVEDRDAISLAMPVTWKPYEWGRGLHPVFSMNMPEGALKEAIARRFSKAIKGFDDFALLGVVGQHQLGRVRVTAEGMIGDVPPGQSVNELLVHDGAQGLFDDLMNTYAAYSGVSGVQPKVLLRDSDVDADRLTHKGSTHIIKAWRPGEFDELAANEYFCMQAAKYSGIEVPELQLSATGKLLAIRRFDLVDDQYLGHEDFCVLSGFTADQKYDGSYEGIARLIKAYVSPGHVEDALQAFFKIVALSAGIQNGDAHLKNFGVVYDHCGADADVRLAPAYDLVSTTPYIPRDSMALTLGGSKAWPKEKMLAKFGRAACGLTEGECRQAMEQVADGMAMAYRDLQDHVQQEPSFMAIGQAMQDSWDAGCARSLMQVDRPVRFPVMR